ncbi:MAG: DUF6120 family protein [Lachnospiraceae bacterium]|nr:DUF6120 family protein [Lachnospiraceae bacterium]
MKEANKIQRQYIAQIKTLFPIIDRQERTYLKKLQLLIEDYCRENQNISIETLYKEFGVPSDIVNGFYSEMDIADSVKRIRRNIIAKKSFRYGIVVLLVILITYCVGMGIVYKTRKDINSHKIYNNSEEYVESLEGEYGE